jgi:hypothetical protein
MKVRELIQLLEQYSPDSEVMILTLDSVYKIVVGVTRDGLEDRVLYIEVE